MVITKEIKTVMEDSAFLTIITMSPGGSPHPIIVGKGAVEGDSITAGVYAMKVTQENLTTNDCAMVLGSKMDEAGPNGYRLTGTAKVEGDKFVFTATKAEALI